MVSVLFCLTAHGTEWKVRLYWLNPPAEAQMAMQGKPAVRLTSASRPVHFSGPLVLTVPGAEPVRVEFPMDIAVREGRLRFTVTMPREEYVAGVMAGESSVITSEEALKAMTVAARTYAVHFRGRHAAEGFDFCDTTHCQDLRLSARSERLRKAADATEAEVLWFAGSPAAAYYSRHCGGMTEAGETPYLPRQHDGFCLARSPGEWHTELSAGELRNAGLSLPVQIIERTPSGRVKWLLAGGRRLSTERFLGVIGETAGWDRLRSSWFNVEEYNGRLAFEGRGSGHGIGLCQTGAAKMGDDGRGYRDILAFYYPGTKIGINAQSFPWSILGGERVEVWTTSAGSDGAMVALADRLRRKAEQAAGLRGPDRIRVRVYPSVAAFRDATGEPGTVAASTTDTAIRMQPAAVLRSRGVLESTLFHEMIHAVLDAHTRRDVPLWFREELAVYLEGRVAPSARMRSLIEQHGRETVLSWLERGLPAMPR